MPDMDGYTLYSRLKKIYPSKEFNVIFVTGLDRSEYETKGLELGGMDYITKLFSSSLAQERIRNRLNMIRSQKQQKASAHDEKMLTVGSLAIGMAHEINNSLAGMMQNTQLIVNRLTKDIPTNKNAARLAGTTMGAIREYVREREIILQLERINQSGIQSAKILEKILEFTAEENSAMVKVDLTEILNSGVAKVLDDPEIKKIKGISKVRGCF
jgi:DNA-binding response OmpR family regulator